MAACGDTRCSRSCSRFCRAFPQGYAAGVRPRHLLPEHHPFVR
ncbi:hypothetical protein [Bacteroides sp. ET489]